MSLKCFGVGSSQIVESHDQIHRVLCGRWQCAWGARLMITLAFLINRLLVDLTQGLIDLYIIQFVQEVLH